MSYGGEQVYLEKQGVARHNLLTELYIVNLKEICRPTLWFLNGVEHQQTSTLCHGFYLKHSRHNGLLWKVSLEERLIGGNVLYADDSCCSKRDNN